jgi:ATP-dependent RNA/DNA helicase IGHMBP2
MAEQNPEIDHFFKLKSLLEVEEKEDYLQYRRDFIQANLDERRRNGVTWYPLNILSQGVSIGGQQLLSVERNNHLHQAHQFSSGKNVILFSNAQGKDIPELYGTIKSVYDNQMSIMINDDDLPDWVFDGKIGVNLSFDDTTYEEMRQALMQVINAKDSQLQYLREIFANNRKPRFSEPDASIVIPKLNLSQNKAVRHALAAEDVALIQGPPGTGKTTTIVQAIRLTVQKEKQVLVCAPSNTAVDVLTEKLIQEGLKVLRIGHPARIDETLLSSTLDGQITQHSGYKDLKNFRKSAEEYFKMASDKRFRSYGPNEREQKTLMYQEAKSLKKEAILLENYIIDSIVENAQVVCCTPVNANHYLLKKTQFHTLFFDEAGQCLEPMAWIPILRCKKLVFSGDHWQLPPTIKSRQAENGGLKISLFERAIQNLPENALLSIQYRMHEDIMQFSNEYFYNGLLQADLSAKNNRLSYDSADVILHRPLECIDTAGCGFEEEQNPETLSLYNTGEAKIVVNKIKTLLAQYQYHENAHSAHLSIGIITPYKEQKEYLEKCIKEQLEIPTYVKIVVKTVDGFQGQEKDVIILSLVRSNHKQEIGFLADERRLNVSLTRARKKLIVIGDSATLSNHPFFEKLFEFYANKEALSSAWELMSDLE